MLFLNCIVACKRHDKKEWKTLDFKSFTLKTPSNWEILKEKGIDSNVGGLTNGIDSLYFDYGWYSQEVGDEEANKHKFTTDTVNGKIASIVIPTIEGDGQTAMSISQFKDNQNRFIIGGTNVKDNKLVLQIFKSLTFPESDTNKNSVLTIEKFKNSSTGTGKSLFMASCAACHSKLKNSTGPALNDISTKRTNEWIYTYLTKRNTLEKDKRTKDLQMEYGINCIEVKALTREQVDRIINYIN